MNTELRKDCPMRHKNGNCMPAGGFCTAVNDPICEALHNAYDTGRRAADVVEVKHGYWYRHDKKIHGDTCYHCSECEKMALTDCGMVWELTPYCPFCGAKMDAKED